MSAPIDPRDLRNALGVFATGVTVVTTRDEAGQPRGFTANSFTSVSLDPPLVLVCIGKTLSAAPVFTSARHFAVNILAAQQQHVSDAFGRPGGQRFEAADWTPGAAGSPLLHEVAAWLECASHDIIEQGDHVLLIGRVLDYAYTSVSPLGYCRGAYVPFGLAEEALHAVQDPGPVRVGAVVERNGDIYLEEDATGHKALPTASRLGSGEEAGSLIGRLAGAGVKVDLSFLYAVFEDSGKGIQYIFYRAEARELSPRAREHFAAFDAIPWDRLPDDATRTMLRRYVNERQQNIFGIYVGDHHSGTVRSVSP